MEVTKTLKFVGLDKDNKVHSAEAECTLLIFKTASPKPCYC